MNDEYRGLPVERSDAPVKFTLGLDWATCRESRQELVSCGEHVTYEEHGGPVVLVSRVIGMGRTSETQPVRLVVRPGCEEDWRVEADALIGE